MSRKTHARKESSKPMMGLDFQQLNISAKDVTSGDTTITAGPVVFAGAAAPGDLVKIEPSLPGKPLADVIADLQSRGILGDLANARKDLSSYAHSDLGKPTIKSLRLQAGLSQTELADRLGTSQSYVARLEKGQIRDIGTRRLNQLCVEFGVDAQVVLEAINGS